PNRIFNAHHIQQIARFGPGKPYSTDDVDVLRHAIIQTGVVSAVDIKPVQTAQPDMVYVGLKMEPAPPRTFSA
ncbi:hypothetical protein ACSTI6_23715, partial [Vibrio parahaemolyticus]